MGDRGGRAIPGAPPGEPGSQASETFPDTKLVTASKLAAPNAVNIYHRVAEAPEPARIEWLTSVADLHST